MAEASAPDSGANLTAFVGRMGTDENFAHSIPNAWMASPPGHPFWHLMLKWTRERLDREKDRDDHDIPEALTGPIALRNGVIEYSKSEYHPSNPKIPAARDGNSKPAAAQQDPEARANAVFDAALPQPHEVVVLPFHHIYPYSWDRDGSFVRDVCWSLSNGFNETRCKELLAVDRWHSTAITYWSHSWNDDGHNTGNLDKVS
jgi:hypothetical protein